MVQRPARNAVPLEQRWDLDGLYPTMAAWEADVTQVQLLLPELAAFSGRLDTGAGAAAAAAAAELLACLRLRDEINLIGSRVIWFARHRYMEDQGDPDRVALLDRVGQLEGAMQATQAFIRPELLAVPEAAVTTWLAAEAGLAPYRLHLTDILAEKAHMLGIEGETVLAEISPLLQAPFDIWQQTTNVDVKFTPIHDEEGNEVPMSLGISAAAAFADMILTADAGALERYLDFLRAGSSAHPLALFKAAGLDMATPAPVERAVGVYADLVAELERL